MDSLAPGEGDDSDMNDVDNDVAAMSSAICDDPAVERLSIHCWISSLSFLSGEISLSANGQPVQNINISSLNIIIHIKP